MWLLSKFYRMLDGFCPPDNPILSKFPRGVHWEHYHCRQCSGSFASLDCRKQDVWFMWVQCTLDFAPLIKINPYPGGTVLWVSCYNELPQESWAMLNGAGANFTLVSYLGAVDLHTLLPNGVKTTILTPVLQGWEQEELLILIPMCCWRA